MSWPDVALVVVTYDRPQEIRRTLQAFLKNVWYEGTVWCHIADDGSPHGYVEALYSEFPIRSHTVTQREGWAGNVNMALGTVYQWTDYVFLIEDDYVSKRVIDLNRGVSLLESVSKIGNVRYDGIEGHQFMLRLCEAQTRMGKTHYMVIEKRLGPSSYVYSNRPHLFHRRFTTEYGWYPTGLTLGSTELVYADKVLHMSGPETVILADGIIRAFDHIGKSRQGTSLDRGRSVIVQ